MLCIDRDRGVAESGAEQLSDAAQRIGRTRRQMLHVAAVSHFELDVETRERQPRDDVVQVREFGALGLQKLAPCRRVVEQIGHIDGRAARVRDRRNARRIGGARVVDGPAVIRPFVAVC